VSRRLELRTLLHALLFESSPSSSRILTKTAGVLPLDDHSSSVMAEHQQSDWDSNPGYPLSGVGGSRTLVSCLPDMCSPIELQPREKNLIGGLCSHVSLVVRRLSAPTWWRENSTPGYLDSDLDEVAGMTGLEPAVFRETTGCTGHYATSPFGTPERNRTSN
jgi:hypothetical protein